MTEVITRKVVVNEEDLNRDPITGTPGAHPLGTAAGAASGAVAGAAVGTAVGGPVGAVIGAAVGRWQADWRARARRKRSTPLLKKYSGERPTSGNPTMCKAGPTNTTLRAFAPAGK